MTLRTRMLIGLTAIVVMFGVSGFLVVHTQRRYLVSQVDRQLEALGPAAFAFRSGRPAPVGGRPGSPSDSLVSELYVGEFASDGTLSTLLAGGLLEGRPDITLARVVGRFDLGEFSTFSVDGTGTSSRFRVRVLHRPDDVTWLVVALPLSRTDDAMNRLLLAIGSAALVVVAMGALVAWWVVRLGLRPIKQMTIAADAVAGGARGHRVEFDDPRTEAGRLGRAFNVMLDERQGAEDRLRRFVADASHELRTPITSIRGYADLYEQHGLDEPGRLDDAMRRVGQEATRMGGLVEDLLLLANLDQGRPLAHDPVDLGEILNDAAADALATQPGRQVRLDTPGPGELVITGDEARLRQVVGALVHNALVHTPESAELALTGRRAGDLAVLEVRDAGPGMEPEAAAKAFERFFRGDASRSRHRGGSGLGLSIAESVVEAHGGRISLTTTPGEGCTFTVALPASAPS